MEKIPTISEFIAQCRGSLEFDPNGEGHPPNTAQVAVAFAKLHAEAALNKASERYLINETEMSDCPKYLSDIILNAYPLENIK